MPSVGGQRRQVEEELRQMELKERELTNDLHGLSDHLQEVQEQIKQVKSISQRRIERELIGKN